MNKLDPPPALQLTGNVAENWKNWKQQHELYMIASELEEKSETVKVAILLHTIGQEALHVYNTFELTSEEQDNKYEAIINHFQAYCEPKKNIVFQRYKFWQRNQKETETIDQYVTELKSLAIPCQYETQTDNIIRDRLIFGCKNIRLKERLLREAPDLNKTIAMSRAAEMTMEQLREMTSETAAITESDIHVLTKPQAKSPNLFMCNNCGFKHGPRACPAYGKQCRNCGRSNHYAKWCRKKKYDQISNGGRSKQENNSRLEVKSIHELENAESDSDEIFIGHLQSPTKNGKNEWKTKLRINGTPITFKLDTGAHANVMPLKLLTKINTTREMQQTKTTLTAFGNSKITPKGKIILQCKIHNNTYDIPFYVVDVDKAILGLETCINLKLIQRNIVSSKEINNIDKNNTTHNTSEQIIKEYDDVFKGIGCMERKYHIELDKNIRPIVEPTRRVPLALMPKLKESLEALQRQKIIVKIDEPTDWVSALLIKEKKDGKLRLCLDPRHLNKAIKREHFQMPTALDIAHNLSGKQIFSIIDMKHGYHNIQLDEDSSKLCTFGTPFGRYKYLRLPFGISSAPEVFQKRVQEIFENIEGVYAVADDIIIAAKSTEEHHKILRQVLNKARKSNIKFNREKLQLCMREVRYLGQIINSTGVRPDETKIEAIRNLAKPKNVADIRKLLGTINHLSSFIPNVAEITAPMRSLLKNNHHWNWTHEQDKALEHIRTTLSTEPVLQHFDENKPITIQADASQNGLGACLLQEGHPITYASKALTPTEMNYPQIDKEFLAILFACERFNHYVYGRNIEIHTDHKPLVSIVKKSFDKISPRMQRMLIRLMKYNTKLIYKPGKEQYIADTLSRATSTGGDQESADKLDMEVHELSQELPISQEWQIKLEKSTKNDEMGREILKMISKGWPRHKDEIKPSVRPLWEDQNEVYERNGIILKNKRIYIPLELRAYILELLHDSHLGIEKTKAKARSTVYWPNLDKDIEEHIGNCHTCTKYRNRNPKQKLLPHQVPTRPWEKIGADIFECKDKIYLMIVDYYSKYPEVIRLKNKTSEAVIQALKSTFARHGIPEQMISDNMPFQSIKCKEFAEDWKMKITTSSPCYPQSNGQSERMIQTVKKLIIKAEETKKDIHNALLEYRTTPISGLKWTPSQLLMSRQLRTKIPIYSEMLKPKVVLEATQDLEERQEKQRQQHDMRHHHNLRQLQEGQRVGIRTEKDHMWETGTVKKEHTTPRSYVIERDDGQLIRRTRQHLQPIKIKKSITKDQQDETPEMGEYGEHGKQKVAEQQKQKENMELGGQEQENEGCATKVQGDEPMVSVGVRERKWPVRFKDFVMG